MLSSRSLTGTMGNRAGGVIEVAVQDVEVLKCPTCGQDRFVENKTGRLQPGRTTFELKFALIDVQYRYTCLSCGAIYPDKEPKEIKEF